MMLSFNLSFADSVSFDGQPISSGDTLPMYLNGDNVRSLLLISGEDFYVIRLTDSSPTFYFVSTTLQTPLSNIRYARADNPGTTVTPVSYAYDSTTNLYYYQLTDLFSWGESTTYLVPAFDTLNNALSAVRYYIDNPSTPPSVVGDGYLTNGLPVGNVIYFDLGSSGVEYDITLRSYFNSYSSYFGIGASWVNDNRRYGFSDSLPTTSTNFDESSGSSLSWAGYGKPTISGRYQEGESNIFGTSTGRYLWIVNPLYNSGYYDDPDKGSSLNGNIFYIGGLSVDTLYYSYKLKQSATSLGLSSDVASSVGGVGSVTSSGAINTVVNDGSNDEYVPSVGGDNTPPQEVSATDGIKQILDQFVQMFLNIFTAPISHIQQLISSGSEFISHISGLWAWLPSEVSGFVLSAFVVMVAISIFKLFL